MLASLSATCLSLTCWAACPLENLQNDNQAWLAEPILHKHVLRLECVHHYATKKGKFVEMDYELKGIGWADAFNHLKSKLMPAGWAVDLPPHPEMGFGMSILAGPGGRRASLEKIGSGALEFYEIRPVASNGKEEPVDPYYMLHEMIDQTYQKEVSTDRRYVAKLMYNEAGSMTFGYFHVDLAAYGQEREEVAEVAAEGLMRIRWSGRRELVIYYDPKEVKADLWVKRASKWRDVRIRYEKDRKSVGR